MKIHTWYSIGEIKENGGSLTFCLLPDHYDSSVDTPVLEFNCKGVSCPIKAELNAKFKHDFILDIELHSNKFCLWGEFDDEPFVAEAKEVTVIRKNYSIEQLKDIISWKDELIDTESKNSSALHQKLESIDNLIDELIVRANRKKEKGFHTEIRDGQIRVLNRIKSRLNGT